MIVKLSSNIRASRKPLDLYFLSEDFLASVKPSSVYFERFQKRRGFLTFVFFIAARSWRSLKSSFPSKLILFTFTRFPRSILILMFCEISMPAESITGVVVIATLVFKKPSFWYFFTMWFRVVLIKLLVILTPGFNLLSLMISLILLFLMPDPVIVTSCSLGSSTM